MSRAPRILVVRRDNIGDLVCTTPLIAALRRRYPDGWLGALVNSYNAPVLAGNPDLDAVIAYRKLKHLEHGESAVRALGSRVAALWRLRRARLDWVVLATPDESPRLLRLARWLAPKRVAGFASGAAAARGLDVAVPLAGLRDRHEVEQVFALAAPLGAEGPIPPLRVVPEPGEVARARAAIGPGRCVAVHLSARRPAQRWPLERFVELILALAARDGVRILLLWSPGAADHPQHPGDDARAAEVVRRIGARAPLLAWRTQRLAELTGALAASDLVFCADGGAMHLAAALGKPVVALFGDSPLERWRPWGVPHAVLRPASRDVRDLPLAEALQACAALLEPGA